MKYVVIALLPMASVNVYDVADFANKYGFDLEVHSIAYIVSSVIAMVAIVSRLIRS